MSDGLARSLMPLYRGEAVPVPRADWERWPSGFQTHADGLLYVTGALGGPGPLMGAPGQYHPVSISAIDWDASDRRHKAVTLLWV